MRWPDGGTTPGWVVGAHTPVWLDLGGDGHPAVVRVYALDQKRAFADIPRGWVTPVTELTGNDSAVAPF